MRSFLVDEHAVKSANRTLYDTVADSYETIDGRRSIRLETWLRGNLSRIRKISPGGSLLDIGTGNGFVSRCADSLFTPRVGLDLSPRIISASKDAFDHGVAADSDLLPFRDNSFDVITCFAVLHHLYSFKNLVAQISRVLKPGGVFYSDHDLDACFARRYRWLLSLYRGMKSAAAKYHRYSSVITAELYRLAEWQAGGINAMELQSLLESNGLRPEIRFHWFGLNPVFDVFQPFSSRNPGWAPLVSIIAIKQHMPTERSIV